MDLKKIAIEKDNTDNLKTFKSKFINNPNEIYLDGNSLGKLPVESIKNLNEVINNQWGVNLIRSWNDNWLNYSKKLMAKMKQAFGFKGGVFFSCHARFFLALKTALNGVFPTIFLRGHNG